MPLNVGSRLGPYSVTVLIGAGGMGEVYKARDTRLDRTVAKGLSSVPCRHGLRLTGVGSRAACYNEIWPCGEGVGV